MKRFLIILFLSSTSVYAADDHCSYFKYCGTASPAKTSSSSSSSPSLNPSNIARVKGLGVETLFQTRNDIGFSVVTGTGTVGGALISSSGENSFFGNRSLELDEDYLARYREKKRYKNNKIGLAIGLKVYDKKNTNFDVGISLKRHKDIRKINPGLGFSANYKIITVGAHVYRDDVRLELKNYFDPYSGQYYAVKYNSPTYDESYIVKTFSLGIKLSSLTFDVGHISTNYKFYNDPTDITIYSLGYTNKDFHVTAAYRTEISRNRSIQEDTLTFEPEKSDYYLGVQYMAFKHLMFGIGYNTFLMKELSATMTIFLN